MCGVTAQLVEHRTGIAEVTGSNPVEALNFFVQASSFQLLKLEIYCDGYSLISSTPAVQNMKYFIYTTHQHLVLDTLFQQLYKKIIQVNYTSQAFRALFKGCFLVHPIYNILAD